MTLLFNWPKPAMIPWTVTMFTFSFHFDSIYEELRVHRGAFFSVCLQMCVESRDCWWVAQWSITAGHRIVAINSKPYPNRTQTVHFINYRCHLVSRPPATHWASKQTPEERKHKVNCLWNGKPMSLLLIWLYFLLIFKPNISGSQQKVAAIQTRLL